MLKFSIDVLNNFAVDVAAKKNDLWFQRSGACFAVRYGNARNLVILDIGVAVRRGLACLLEERIQSLQSRLQLLPVFAPMAFKTDDLVQPAMQVNHLPAAGFLVQSVNVLCHQQSAGAP